MKKGTIVLGTILIITIFICLLIIQGVGSKNINTEKNADIAITEENFSNPWLKDAVSEQLDKDHDGNLSFKEINEAAKLELKIGDSNAKLRASEINCFPNLEQLTIELSGESKCLEMGKLENIKKLECRFMSYETINLICSEMKNLSYVTITAEDEMYPDNDKRYQAFVEIKKCPVVQKLETRGNGLRQLVLSDVPELKEVFIDGFGGSSLNICDLPGVEELEIYNAKWLTDFMISGTPVLKKLFLSKLKVTSLDLHSVKSLESINISDASKLREIMLGNLPHLEELSIATAKKLEQIDLGKLDSLKELCLDEVPLKKLNLSKCRKIKVLAGLRMKTIQQIELSNQKEMESFEWKDGNLKIINWGEKKKLLSIDVSDNNLSGKINLARFPQLQELTFDNNNIEELHGRSHKAIEFISGNNNNLRLIDMRQTYYMLSIAANKNDGVAVYLSSKAKAFDTNGHFNYKPEKEIGPNARFFYEEER